MDLSTWSMDLSTCKESTIYDYSSTHHHLFSEYSNGNLISMPMKQKVTADSSVLIRIVHATQQSNQNAQLTRIKSRNYRLDIVKKT